MPLYFFYTMVQKKTKMTTNSNQGGPALILYLSFFLMLLYMRDRSPSQSFTVKQGYLVEDLGWHNDRVKMVILFKFNQFNFCRSFYV